MNIIDSVMIMVGVDGKEAKKGIDQVNGYMDDLKSKIKGLAVGFAGIYAVGQTFSNYLAEADALGKFSDSIGQNIEDVHAWQEAVKRCGGSAESFQGSIKGLSAQLSRMELIGTSKVGRMLEEMGIATTDANGKARETFDVLGDLADKFKDMSAPEATAKGQLIGFDSGFVALLREGRDGVKDLVNKQKELGVYTKEDAKVTAEFNDQLDDSKQAFMGVAKTVMVMIVPAMKTLAEWTTKFFVYLRQHQTFIKAFFVMIATLITALLIPTLMELFATLLANPITWAVLALAGLALVIEDLVTWAEGGESALADFWEAIFGDKDTAIQLWNDMTDAVMGFINYITTNWDAVKTILMLTFPILSALIANWDKIKPVIISAIKIVVDFAKRFRFSLLGASLALQDFVNKAKVFIGNVADKFDFLVNAISFAWLWLASKIDEVLGWIQGKIDEVLAWIEETFGVSISEVMAKWEELKNTAVNVLRALFSPIDEVANKLKGTIGSAIDWLSEKWQNFKSAVAGGASAGDIATANGGGGNSYDTTWNVTMNGVAGGSDAVNTFRQGVGNRYNAGQSDSGS